MTHVKENLSAYDVCGYISANSNIIHLGGVS